MKPDLKKNVLAQIWAQIRPKIRFLANISRKNSAIVEINERNHSWKFQVQKKICSLDLGMTGQILGKPHFLQFGTW